MVRLQLEFRSSDHQADDVIKASDIVRADEEETRRGCSSMVERELPKL